MKIVTGSPYPVCLFSDDDISRASDAVRASDAAWDAVDFPVYFMGGGSVYERARLLLDQAGERLEARAAAGETFPGVCSQSFSIRTPDGAIDFNVPFTFNRGVSK